MCGPVKVCWGGLPVVGPEWWGTCADMDSWFKNIIQIRTVACILDHNVLECRGLTHPLATKKASSPHRPNQTKQPGPMCAELLRQCEARGCVRPVR